MRYPNGTSNIMPFVYVADMVENRIVVVDTRRPTLSLRISA
ncbi:hypothetical protein [Polycladospora coralii]|nr:hypothetical protein [Polycladospora coralii]